MTSGSIPLRIAATTLCLIGLWAGPVVAQSTAQPQTLCIKSAKANLRSGPGTTFRVTWEVHRYMPLVKVAQNGE